MKTIHPLLLVLAWAGSAVPTFAFTPQDLEEAQRLLAANRETDCRKGARICVDLNSEASTEALLEVLRLNHDRGLPKAHYRDVAWDALRDITDPYAQNRVEAELSSNRKDPLVRQWCAELLGLYGDVRFGPALTKALADKEEFVRAAAARAVGRVGYAKAVKPLSKGAKSKDPILRGNAIEALVRIDPAEYAGTYAKGLEDRDGGVRCLLYGVAPTAYPERAEELSVRALEDGDWRPRLQGVENLASVRTKTAVDALVGATEDPRPVVAKQAIASLQLLTGEKHTRPDQWERWWVDHREAYRFPEGRGQLVKDDESRTVATFNQIVLESDHVAFLLDKSTAMGKTLASRSVSKDEAAAQELSAVLESMEGRMVFNVFCYELEIRPFEKRSVELTRKTAKRALDFHGKTSLRGHKDIWSALLAVLEDHELDTAFLLSSGEPDTGTYVHWDRIVYQLQELNRFHKVVFHAIAYTDSDWHREQLQKIAEATGGEFRAFD